MMTKKLYHIDDCGNRRLLTFAFYTSNGMQCNRVSSSFTKTNSAINVLCSCAATHKQMEPAIRNDVYVQG